MYNQQNTKQQQPNQMMQQQQQQQLQQYNSILHNVLDIHIVDDNVKLLSQLILKHIDNENIEIEAKLGFLTVKDNISSSQQRLTIAGIQTIVPVDMLSLQHNKIKPVFNSTLDVNMFNHLRNNVLHNKYNNDKQNINNHNTIKQCNNIHTIDYIYNYNNRQIRVTRNKVNNNIINIIEKDKLEHIDYFNPNRQSCDFRISVNVENNCMNEFNNNNNIHQLTDLIAIRDKERQSYLFDIWSIDCTIVKSYNQNQIDTDTNNNDHTIKHDVQPYITYEIELECINANYIRYHASLYRNNKPNQLTYIAHTLYDNVVTLAKFAIANVQPPHTCIQTNINNR